MAVIIGLAQGQRPGVISNMTKQEWDISSKLYATTSTDSGELRVVYVFKYKTATSGVPACFTLNEEELQDFQHYDNVLSSNYHKRTEDWTRIYPEHNWRCNAPAGSFLSVHFVHYVWRNIGFSFL